MQIITIKKVKRYNPEAAWFQKGRCYQEYFNLNIRMQQSLTKLQPNEPTYNSQSAVYIC
jgi:hypothetical protein